VFYAASCICLKHQRSGVLDTIKATHAGRDQTSPLMGGDSRALRTPSPRGSDASSSSCPVTRVVSPSRKVTKKPTGATAAATRRPAPRLLSSYVLCFILLDNRRYQRERRSVMRCNERLVVCIVVFERIHEGTGDVFAGDLTPPP
jgi:hypothetical protein